MFIFSFDLKKKVRHIRNIVCIYRPVVRKWCKTCLLTFFCWSIFFVWLYTFVRPPFTPLMIIRSIDKLVHLQAPIWDQTWVPIEKISPYVVYAVIAAEDNKFVTHFGFDVQALQNAIEYDLSHKWSTIWGSTISQQTAKNVFLRPGRDFLRKWLEAYFTLLMESMWSKERIMEVYLNDIEFGDGIYGIEAASQYYFHTPAKKLTSYQASLLAAILPNPRYYQTHLNTYLIQRRKNAISNNIGRVRGNKQTRTFVKSLKN